MNSRPAGIASTPRRCAYVAAVLSSACGPSVVSKLVCDGKPTRRRPGCQAFAAVRVPRDPCARAAGVRAPQLRDAPALEELPAARGVAEADAARARRARSRSARRGASSSSSGSTRGRGSEHHLALAQLRHDRRCAHAGVDALDGRRRRGLGASTIACSSALTSSRRVRTSPSRTPPASISGTGPASTLGPDTRSSGSWSSSRSSSPERLVVFAKSTASASPSQSHMVFACPGSRVSLTGMPICNR